MSTFKNARSRLISAQMDLRAVRIERASRAETLDGFVVGVGRKWALIASTIDGGFFSGHVAIRLTDIARVRGSVSFESRFSRTRPEWPPRPPEREQAIDLETTAGMLSTFLQPGVLLAIDRTKHPDSMWVGVPSELTRRWFYLREVTPQAEWKDEPLGYRLRTLVSVRIGDHYLQGLAAIAGTPPRA